MSLGTSSDRYDSGQTFDSCQKDSALFASTQTIVSTDSVCLAEESMAVRQLAPPLITSSLIYFVDRAVPHLNSGATESGYHQIVEGRLEKPTEITKDLVERYGNTPVELMIVLHKQSLVGPILRLMSEIENHPELFNRSRLTIIPHIFRDQKIFDWVAEKPFARLPRIKIAG